MDYLWKKRIRLKYSRMNYNFYFRRPKYNYNYYMLRSRYNLLLSLFIILLVIDFNLLGGVTFKLGNNQPNG
jgi:hypothetical protein